MRGIVAPRAAHPDRLRRDSTIAGAVADEMARGVSTVHYISRQWITQIQVNLLRMSRCTRFAKPAAFGEGFVTAK
jgi:hypothetical protein